MKTGDLRALWREVFGNLPHRRLRRELLIQILGYRLQERALGGLKPSTTRRLLAIAEATRAGKKQSKTQSFAPRPGTRMVRQWQGKLHEVITVESGFLYDGKKYRSLSKIARVITGTKWSGSVFFGLRKRKTTEVA